MFPEIHLIAFLPTYYVVYLQVFLKSDIKRIVYVEKHYWVLIVPPPVFMGVSSTALLAAKLYYQSTSVFVNCMGTKN